MTVVIAVANQTFRGVSLLKKGVYPWQARISHGGREFYLGAYGTPEEAARAYDYNARRLKGASAILNFPDEVSDTDPRVVRRGGPALAFGDTLTKEYLAAAYLRAQKRVSQIAEEHQVDPLTVRNYLRRHGIHLRPATHFRKYPEPKQIEGFVGPAGDWHAYWLGFIAADGCVFTSDGKRKHHVVRIQLKSDDAPHLEEFRRGLETDVPVRIGGGKANITLHSPRFVEVLASWGIAQKKSLTLRFPALPEASIGAFVRGYFDGDGTIYWRRQPPQPICRFISGSRQFLDKLQAILARHGIDTSAIYQSTGNALHLPVRSRRPNLRAFAEFLYAGSTVHLERKYQAFRPVMERGY